MKKNKFVKFPDLKPRKKNGVAPHAKLERRRRVATNSKFDIFFDHIVDAEGREVRKFLVVQPKARAKGGITGVCVLPVVGDKIALVRCYRHPIGATGWEAPKGFVEPGETPRQAALRELKEETGLVCSARDLVALGYVAPEAGVINGRLALFAASNCGGALRADESDIGMGAAVLFTRTKVDLMVEKSAIEDGATLAVYYRYKHGSA